jgi:tetratricopeptide (TPR) repeat protein
MECLADSQLVDLASGAAPPEIAASIDAHLESCTACWQLMVNLADVISASSQRASRTAPHDRAYARTVAAEPAAPVSRRYRILGLLGEGGMGRVYRAVDRLTGTPVAFKQVLIAPRFAWARGLRTSAAASRLPDGTQVRTQHGSLAEEFRTLATLRHPNVISVLDYGFDASRQPFYTMELLDGAQPILAFSAGRPPGQQAELLIQLLHALAYLHRRGIVHRDLSARNVLVVQGEAGPVVKVLDFGLAVNEESGCTAPAAGTPLYMAPELLRGEAASASSDLYAVGVLAYQMLACRHPYTTEQGAARLLQEVLEAAPDLSPLAPAWRPIIGQALSKQPASRPADAATFLRGLATAANILIESEPVAARDSYLVAARFVGRQAELLQLQSALKTAQQGRGSAWLIGGESGVGKSRLLEELRNAALVAGALSARGQAAPSGAAYHVWQEVLRVLALQVQLSELEASVLSAVVPDLATLLERAVEAPQELDAPSTRLRLFHVVGEVLERLPETALVLLEDLQWADSESLALLAHLAGVATARAVLVVATYRDDEAPRLAAALPQLQPLPLGRLDRPAMQELCSSMLGRAGQDSLLLDLIAAETEGNTYFIVEVMRALAAESGSLASVGRSGLPQRVLAGGLEQVLQRRLGRVPQEARALLQVAAVAGRQLDLTLLSKLVPHAEAQVRDLADVGILDLHAQSWRFSHDKLRERVCDALDGETRRELHGRLAQALEQVYPGEPSHAAKLAFHYREARQLAPAARCYLLAGCAALSHGAPAEGAALLQQARALHEQVATPRLAQVQVWRGLTQAHFALGRLRESELALRQVCALAGTPLPTGTASFLPLIGRMAAGLVASRLGLPRRAPALETEERAIWNELLEALEVEEVFVWTDQPELGLLCTLWGMKLEELLTTESRRTYHSSALFFILSFTPLRGLCRRYLERHVGKVTPGTHTEINYLRVRALVEINDCKFQAAAKYAAQAVALARTYKDDLGLLHSLLQLQLAVAGLDDYEQMLQVSREMEQLAALANHPRDLALAYLGQGGARMSQGAYAEAVLLVDRARAYLPHELGPVPEAVVLGLAASGALHLGQCERAVELAATALSTVQRARWTLLQLRYPLTCILEVYLALDRPERYRAQIEAALDRLQKIARQFAMAVPASAMYQGIYWWKWGHPRRALAAFRKSLAAAGRLKLQQDLATTQYWVGCFAQSPQGRSLMPEGSAPYLLAALATDERLGAAGMVASIRGALQNSSRGA